MTSYRIRPARGLRVLLAVAVAAVALAVSTVLDTPSAAAADDTTSCARPGPIFHRVPDLGPRLPDISDYSFAYCWPGEDTVRILYDDPGSRGAGAYSWYYTAVDGPTWGHRVGWIRGYFLSPPPDLVARARRAPLSGPGHP